MNFREMIDEVRRAGGMDVDVGRAGNWLNERYKRLCVRSNWTKSRVEIGTTAADQARYALPEVVAEIHELRLGGTPYQRTGVQSLWDLGNTTFLSGSGGVYAPMFDTDGTPQIEVNPVPSDGGDLIEALATVEPDDLAGGAEPLLPVDYHRCIVEGALADAFALLDENIVTADYYEKKFDTAIEGLRRRQNKRLGGGPHQVKIYGVHY